MIIILNKKWNYYVLNVLICLLIFRTGFPFFKYIFFSLFLSYSLFTIFQKKDTFFNHSYHFFVSFKIVLLNILILGLSLLLSYKIYSSVLIELFDNFLLIFLFYLIYISTSSKIELKNFLQSFINVTIIFAVAITLIVILHEFNIAGFRHKSSSFLTNGLVNIDYNFSLLPVFIGITGLYKKTLNTRNRLQGLIYSLLILFFAVRIVISGSKRGFVLLIFCVILLLILAFRNFYISKKKVSFLNISKWFLYLFIFTSIIAVIILKQLYYNVDTVRNIDLNKRELFKQEISQSLYRYYSIVNKNTQYLEFHLNLWNLEFNPKNPNSGWGNHPHKSVYPLTGENVSIVPEGSIGYLLDSESFQYNKRPGYYDATSRVFNVKTKTGVIYKASIYCFVSHDFDGQSARLMPGWIYKKDGSLVKYNLDTYDLEQKETWQKIEIEFESVNEDTIAIYITSNRINPDPYKSLNGHVIFAYPELSAFKKDMLNLNSSNKNNYYFISNNVHNYPYISVPIINKLITSNAISSPSALLNKITFIDPIKKKVERISDTTYAPFISNLYTGYEEIGFSEDRLNRWRFAVDIYINEYNLRQKILGKGFNFLNWYGFVFKKDKTKIDYPHNPLLHILLYSGIIGLVLYIYLLIKAFKLYWRFHLNYPSFFLFFLITYYFVFFGGGSPFSPPMMGFFIMLPFFIEAVHKKEKFIKEKK